MEVGSVSSFSLADHLPHTHIGTTQEPSGGTCISQARRISAQGFGRSWQDISRAGVCSLFLGPPEFYWLVLGWCLLPLFGPSRILLIGFGGSFSVSASQVLTGISWCETSYASDYFCAQARWVASSNKYHHHKLGKSYRLKANSIKVLYCSSVIMDSEIQEKHFS